MANDFDPTKLDLDVTKPINPIVPSEEKEGEKTDIQSSKILSSDPLSDDTIADISKEKTSTSENESQVETSQGGEGVLSTRTDESIDDDSITAKSKEQSETILDQIVSEDSSDNSDTNTKLIDINISSLEYLVNLIADKKYSYVLIEPEDSSVKVTFRQDNIDRDIKYIKYPTYTNILFKVKQVTKLVVEDTGSPQEGTGSLKLGAKMYKISSKTAPGQNGERIYIHAKEDTSEQAKKTAQKTSFSMIFGFLMAVLFVALILGGAFISFIVFSAKTVDDVKFFASLGINLNDINTFISQVVTLIFSILLFICTIVLSVCLFKFFLTKKAYRRKKVVYGIVSTFVLFITFATGSAWMFVDAKIKSLPNWQEQAYGDLKIFNNDLLISSDFDTSQSLMSDTQNLIGPITLTFDLNNFQTNQSRKGVTINKYAWNFGGDTIETFIPEITQLFDEKGNYEVSVVAYGTDTAGEEVEQIISNIPSISISHLVQIDERVTNNGGKRLSFDANDLSNLGKVAWYLKEPVSETNPEPSYPEWEEVQEGYEFIPGKIFFDELHVGIAIRDGSESDEIISKVIVIRSDGASDIVGEIQATASLENDLLYTLKVENASTGFANGFIETYEWSIEDKTYTVNGDYQNPKTSPEIEHEFKNFGEQEVRVTLTDSRGKSETLTRKLAIQKRIELRASLIINDENSEQIEEVKYESNTYEYFLNDFGIPASITLDARRVRPMNVIYSLTDVAWDIGGDGNIDGRGKTFEYFVANEGNHIISATYTFEHRKNPDDVITMTEFVYIEGIKKEAILDLKMEYDSNYAPVTVRFDASQSFIKNDDIVKFIYDYGDGVTEERDAINPGHRYSEAGDYTVTLTVVGKSGKRYTTSKDLILLPPAQTVKVTTSLKTAPIGQGIDFSSSESNGQIVEYYWDFGDGNISTVANPTHTYEKTGLFEVTLRADFANGNTITDIVEIEIIKNS